MASDPQLEDPAGMSVDDVTIGARLQAARRALGLTQTQAGDRMDMVTSTVSAIEAGKRAVTGAELYRFAQIYQRPIAYFLETDHPGSAPGFQYLFRAAAEKILDRASLVKLEQLAEDYLSLEEIVGVPTLPMPPDYSTFGLRTEQDAETLAEMERSRLGLGDAPVTGLMDLLDETVGIRTFLLPVDSQNWSSVVVRDRTGRPCIAVNSKEESYRRNFDLAHEYGHALVHLPREDGPQARIDMETDGGRVNAQERFADAFASALLMPRRAVLAQLERLLRASSGQFTDFDLAHLAMHFGVSGQALSARLVTLRKLPREVHRSYWKQRKFKTLAQMLGYDVEEEESFWRAPVVLPTRFRYLAMKAYEGEQISLAKLAELLREDYFELREKLPEGAASSNLGTVRG